MAQEAINIRDKLASAVHSGLKVPAEQARRFAQGFINGLVDDYPGVPLYLGKRTTTDEEVLADFNGKNHAEVCRKHGISQSTLQKKIRAARQRGKGARSEARERGK